MSGISSIQAINNLTATFRTRLLNQTSRFEERNRLSSLVTDVGDDASKSNPANTVSTATGQVISTDGASQLGQATVGDQSAPTQFSPQNSGTALNADLLREVSSDQQSLSQTLLDGGDVVSLRFLGQLSRLGGPNSETETDPSLTQNLLAAESAGGDQSAGRLRNELVDQALVPQFFERTPFIPAGQNAAGFQPPLAVATPASVQAALAANIVTQQNGQGASGLLAKYGLGQRSNGQRSIPVSERRRRSL